MRWRGHGRERECKDWAGTTVPPSRSAKWDDGKQDMAKHGDEERDVESSLPYRSFETFPPHSANAANCILSFRANERSLRIPLQGGARESTRQTNKQVLNRIRFCLGEVLSERGPRCPLALIPFASHRDVSFEASNE